MTEQGERLAAAEQRITVNSDAQSARRGAYPASRPRLEVGDQTLLANITEVARVSTGADRC